MLQAKVVANFIKPAGISFKSIEKEKGNQSEFNSTLLHILQNVVIQMRKGLVQLLSLSDMYLCCHAFPVHYLIDKLNYIVSVMH